MKPIYLTIGDELSLVVIPDTEAHLDGHTVITRTYNIYATGNKPDERLAFRESELHLVRKTDPSYRGELVFEVPGRVFQYFADERALNPLEVQELVEKLSHHRDNPSLWSEQ